MKDLPVARGCTLEVSSVVYQSQNLEQYFEYLDTYKGEVVP